MTQSEENRAYWLAEAERRRRLALDPIASAAASREQARAAVRAGTERDRTMNIMELEEAEGLTAEMVRSYLTRSGWTSDSVRTSHQALVRFGRHGTI